jgi:hypothetical protein
MGGTYLHIFTYSKTGKETICQVIIHTQRFYVTATAFIIGTHLNYEERENILTTEVWYRNSQLAVVDKYARSA